MEIIEKDSSAVQKISLDNFMQALGFFFYLGSYHNIQALSAHKKIRNKEHLTISFANAVKLHNNYYTDWHGVSFQAPWAFSSSQFRFATAGKLVCQVYLQYNKKTKEIVHHQNWVKFVSEDVEKEYYNSKYFKGI